VLRVIQREVDYLFVSEAALGLDALTDQPVERREVWAQRPAPLRVTSATSLTNGG
jgi:hypothetical protein